VPVKVVALPSFISEKCTVLSRCLFFHCNLFMCCYFNVCGEIYRSEGNTSLLSTRRSRHIGEFLQQFNALIFSVRSYEVHTCNRWIKIQHTVFDTRASASL